MDPNATLRWLAQFSKDYAELGNDPIDPSEAAEHIEAMIQWIANGGFQPDWKAALEIIEGESK